MSESEREGDENKVEVKEELERKRKEVFSLHSHSFKNIFSIYVCLLMFVYHCYVVQFIINNIVNLTINVNVQGTIII